MNGVDWVLADLREPGKPVVLCRDGLPRARTSLSRSLTDPLGARRARSLAGLLDEWARSPRSQTPAPFTADGVRCVPVPGTTEDVAAVWLAANSADDVVAPAAAAFGWNARQRRFRVPPESAALVGRRTDATGPVDVLSADALRFIEVDDTLGLVQVLLAPDRGQWTGTATLRRSPESVRAAVSLLPTGPRELSGVVFEAPNVPMTLQVESLAMSSMARVSNIHVVVLDVTKMRVLRWLTDPPSGIAWKGRRDDRDTPHPEDVQRIFDVASPIFRGTALRARVDGLRLRRLDGGWLVVDAAGELVEGSDPPLMIVQMVARGISDEPDPVSPDDRGHPGL